MSEMHITATTIYNLVQCPKRVERDWFGDPAERDPISPFIQMLWDRGTLYEEEVIEGGELQFLDLSGAHEEEKQRLTLEAMLCGERLIYSGRIVAGDLVGVPDLLRRHGKGYLPIDIKSGRATEDGSEDSDGKPKLHYAVQLALYVDILERLGLSAGRRGFVLDVRGEEIEYDLSVTRSNKIKATLWEEYEACLASARAIAAGDGASKGALASACKLCHWYSSCSRELREADDLTLIPVLGRAIRDTLEPTIPTVSGLAQIDPEDFFTKGNKTVFPRLGAERLRTFHARARLLTDPDARPYLKAPVDLPRSSIELFFDIEVDPLRDLTYLHGIVERREGDNDTERFISFFAEEETGDAERDAFAQAMAYLTAEPSATIWFYSKYEPTIYKKLQARYPEVCSLEDIEALFEPAQAVDLYHDVVTKATEWPTNDHSLKTLAKYLGFSWRDMDPSGAASIEWFDQWVRTRDPSVKERILEYNEDDCRATRVLLDGIRLLM